MPRRSDHRHISPKLKTDEENTVLMLWLMELQGTPKCYRFASESQHREDEAVLLLGRASL